MDEADFCNLKSDIEANGQRRPVLLLDGQILDGRHRARACEELGLQTRYETWSGPDPVGFVLSENLHRRHLTPSQKAMIAAKFIEPYRDAANARERAGKEHESVTLATCGARVADTGKAAAIAGASAGVSSRSVERALKITKEGTPDDAREVLEGKVTVNAKAREIAARNPQPLRPKRKTAPPPQAGTAIEEQKGKKHESLTLASRDARVIETCTTDPIPAPKIPEYEPPDDSANVPIVLEFTNREWARLREAAARWHYPVKSFVRTLVFNGLDREDDGHKALTGAA
jgi:hypothetical protein